MKILVTGAAGFIGSHTTESLIARGDEVVGIDNFNSFYDPSIKRRNVSTIENGSSSTKNQVFTLVEGDITDETMLDRVFSQHKFDGIVHLAAWAGVRPSIKNPSIYETVNVRGTLNLLQRAKQYGVTKFVFASSSSVYGGRTDTPFRETDSVDRPISPYAATKKAGELLCFTYHHLYQLNVSVLRYFTVYGPRQRPEMAIHQFASLIKQGLPVPMFGNGDTARDYTYIDDIVQGTVAALDHCNGYEIYNLGEEQTTTLRKLISMLGHAMGKTPTVRQEPEQPGDVPITFADVSKARSKLGYRPVVKIDQGIERFVAWFNAQNEK